MYKKIPIILYLTTLLIFLSSCSSGEKMIRECEYYEPSNFHKIQPEKHKNYKQLLESAIWRVQQNPAAFYNQYYKKKSKTPIGLCKELFKASSPIGNESGKSTYLIDSEYIVDIIVSDNLESLSALMAHGQYSNEGTCSENIPLFLEENKLKQIRGSKGYRSLDISSYAIDLTEDYISKGRMCNSLSSTEEYSIYKIIYNMIKADMGILEVKGCDHFAKYMSSLFLSIRSDSEYPGKNRSYQESRYEYINCIRSK